MDTMLYRNSTLPDTSDNWISRTIHCHALNTPAGNTVFEVTQPARAYRVASPWAKIFQTTIRPAVSYRTVLRLACRIDYFPLRNKKDYFTPPAKPRSANKYTPRGNTLCDKEVIHGTGSNRSQNQQHGNHIEVDEQRGQTVWLSCQV